MSKILVLNAKEIEKIFTMKMALDVVEKAYIQKENKKGDIWPMVFHDFETGIADLDIKSGNLDEDEVFGLKVVSWYGKNPSKGLPALYSTVLLFDLNTGSPKALLNGSAITEYRTGAAGAIGVKYLARDDAKKLVMVGCGSIAVNLVAATLIAKQDIEEVVIINPFKPVFAIEILNDFKNKVHNILKENGVCLNAVIKASMEIEETVRNADIILTATPSYKPMIKKEWIKAGTHFSCIGSDMSGKQEIESEIFQNAKIYCDDINQCLSVGECEIPFKQGVFEKTDGEIGGVITGRLEGRTKQDDITIFDSTGISLQDLASANIIVKDAYKKRIGTFVEL